MRCDGRPRWVMPGGRPKKRRDSAHRRHSSRSIRCAPSKEIRWAQRRPSCSIQEAYIFRCQVSSETMDMLDGVTLDQLRPCIAPVDDGSFSAAGRKLRGAQSVVSQTLANLEAQLGVKLFDRSTRYPRLTEEGRSLLVDARAVADNVDEFKARARAMREGLEPELSVAMDVMYPMEALTRAAVHSRKTYPHTPLRLYVEALGGVIKPVLDRNCSIGIICSLPLLQDELQSELLLSIPFVTVGSPPPPLARSRCVASASA